MSSRTLPLVNAIGCLALTVLVAVQWRNERALDNELTKTRDQLVQSRQQTADGIKRRTALEHDIAVLKEAIEATQKSAEEAALRTAEKDQLITGLQTELNAASQQVGVWEKALKTRDDRILELDASLTATRKRLDEAIQALKDAGAR